MWFISLEKEKKESIRALEGNSTDSHAWHQLKAHLCGYPVVPGSRLVGRKGGWVGGCWLGEGFPRVIILWQEEIAGICQMTP